MAGLKSDGFEMVVQEYIPGGPDQHIYVEGFRDRNGDIKDLFARRRLRMNPKDFGNSTIMRSIPLNEVKQAADDLVRLLKETNYRGIFSAEFKFDHRDALFKILEVNARPWWYIECPAICGINVTEMAYLDALDILVPKVDRYSAGKYFMNFFADLRLWQKEYQAKKAGLTSYWPDWIRAKPTIFRWTDPLPGIMWVIHLIMKRFEKNKRY